MSNVKTLKPSHKLYAELDRVRKYCITKSPGFAGVALLPQYFVVDPKDPMGKEYGFTDGRAIWLGTQLFRETPKAQAFVLIHEVLHVALRHPQRGLALRQKRLAQGLPWSDTVFNWAADAIVNHSLNGLLSWVHKPAVGPIYFENLLTPEVLRDKPPHKWNVESLFVHLMDCVIPQSADAQKIQDWAKSQELPKGGEGMMDLEIPLSGKDQIKVTADEQAEQRNWEQRVKRSAAGDRPGGIMRAVLFDIPVTHTPWQHILRRFISEAVMPQTQIRPSKPSRHMLTIDSFSKTQPEGIPVPFIPAHQQKPGIRKIVVVVDTSGSIDDELFNRFACELQTLRKKLGCDLAIITCDAKVHQIIHTKAQDNLGVTINRAGGFKGGGGTDFRPGVEAAEKIPGAAVIVYLTDMMGNYPQKCKLPLLWAATQDNFDKPPVGKVTVLKDR